MTEEARKLRVEERWLLEENGLFNEEIMREELEQALGKLKQKAAPGSDGLTAEMVSSKE